MRPYEGESESSFILRVEDFRIANDQSEEICFRSFIPQLSVEYRRELKSLARARLVSDLSWREIVADARRANEYSCLTPEDAPHVLSGFGKPVIEPPSDNTIAAVPPEAISAHRKGKSKAMMHHDMTFASSE